MKTIKYLFLLSLLLLNISVYAQIGYQVSLLNNATGEARANERVTVKVKITDSEGKTICDETKNETSNDFGVLSISVGDSKTFENANWSNLPFFIEASVDGRLLGKSQLLSVPLAEYAKKTGILTKELLCSKEWTYYKEGKDWFDETKFSFNEDGTYTRWDRDVSHHSQSEGMYHIDGNEVHYSDDNSHIHTLSYSEMWNCLFWNNEGYVFK